MRAALAALMARTSCGFSRSAPRTVMTTWVSLRYPSAKLGRRGRSMRRAVRMAVSAGRPSRRKNEPGILPAAYMRSSTSTVRGKKSMPSRTSGRGVGGGQDDGVADLADDGALGLRGQQAGLEAQGLGRCRLSGRRPWWMWWKWRPWGSLLSDARRAGARSGGWPVPSRRSPAGAQAFRPGILDWQLTFGRRSDDLGVGGASV